MQMSLPAISHRSRVMRVYKSLLVTQRNWAIDRDVFNTEALKTQALFRSRASETNPTIIAAYVEEAERKLAHFRHPDPYILPTEFGGSKYMRNPAPPESISSDDVVSRPHY
eukprot:TRINITY_DN540_c0_g1_i20.p1 TRINITY_DN540_c0_g1~~TRINITY_DN540_c0_g1_i20.p1  ORF type:complete len:111 (+),score=16.95 TRINITY_DN540_c0_g1_i20:271-603(+)